jgi:hypothetical protein
MLRFSKFILITFVFVLGSCQPKPSFKAPSKFFKDDLERDASPDFAQGWRDGCEVGMSGGSNSFNQMFYDSNKQDGYKMAYSSDYSGAWTRAFWFCYRVDAVDQKSTPFSSMFKGMN